MLFSKDDLVDSNLDYIEGCSWAGSYFADDILNGFSLSLKAVLHPGFNDKSELVQVLAWCHAAITVLLEPMKITQFNDTFMRHQSSVCQVK